MSQTQYTTASAALTTAETLLNTRTVAFDNATDAMENEVDAYYINMKRARTKIDTMVKDIVSNSQNYRDLVNGVGRREVKSKYPPFKKVKYDQEPQPQYSGVALGTNFGPFYCHPVFDFTNNVFIGLPVSGYEQITKVVLQATYSLENIYFYEKMAKVQKPSRQRIPFQLQDFSDKMNHIYDQCIPATSQLVINLPSSLRNEIIQVKTTFDYAKTVYDGAKTDYETAKAGVERAKEAVRRAGGLGLARTRNANVVQLNSIDLPINDERNPEEFWC